MKFSDKLKQFVAGVYYNSQEYFKLGDDAMILSNDVYVTKGDIVSSVPTVYIGTKVGEFIKRNNFTKGIYRKLPNEVH